MDPLSVTASIIAILQVTAKVREYLSDSKDASTDRSQFTTEISNLSKLLVDLLSHFNESSDEPWHAKVRELGGRDGLVYQYRVALEQLKGKVAEGQGIKKIAKSLVWKHVKEDAERILSRIERLKSVVQIALEMDHFKLSEAIESRVKAVQKDSMAMKVGVDALRLDQDRRRHYQIIDWISSDQFPAEQSDLIARRQEETGLWFLDSPEFAEWVRGASPTLFCPGIPGAGKTMMAAITVDHLQKAVQARDVGVGYMYCKYKARADQTAPGLLAAILKQLVQDRPSLAKPLASLYDHHMLQKTSPSLDEITDALQSVLGKYSRVYVVIDALDECADGDRDKLLGTLRNLQSKADLRVIATSRFIPDVVEQFNRIPRLEVRADDADVKRYVVGQTKRLPKFVQRDDELQQLVQDKIVEAVDGMFLLAQLYVGSLLDKDTKKKVRYALSCLRGGTDALKEAYDGAIERIKGQLPGKAARAKSVLSWISYAKRQLTTTELCAALAVEVGDTELDDDNVPDIEELVSVCAGLVTVDEESNVVRLVHYTAQDYLEGIRERWNPSAQYEIASTCLTYLCFNRFRSGSCQSDAEFKGRLEHNPFLDYSARYWGDHAAVVQEEVYELAMRLLKDSSLITCAVQTARAPRYGYRDDSQFFPKQATGLHVAASFGLVYLCMMVLCWKTKDAITLVDSKASDGRTPLSWAAERGHEAVVKMLAERDDVDANSKDNNGRTPLLWAAERGHKAVVKILVERDDVDADSRDKNGQTPLSWAAERGHEAVVKILVERDDVDAESWDKYSQTPLSRAAQQGHKAVVKILVERDNVNADSRDNDGQTPLLWAAQRGHEAVVKILLDNGADLNAQGGFYGNALHAASYQGHTRVLEYLLSRSTAMPLQDRYGRTLLWWAAAGGHIATVELLVTHYYFDPQTPNKFGQTPFWIATKKGHSVVSAFLFQVSGENDTERWALPKEDNNDGSLQCDVCTLAIEMSMFHYHCRQCHNGNWDMCEDCKGRGAFCEDATHPLVRLR